MYVLPQILKKDLNNILEGRIVMNHIFLNQSLFKSTTIKWNKISYTKELKELVKSLKEITLRNINH